MSMSPTSGINQSQMGTIAQITQSMRDGSIYNEPPKSSKTLEKEAKEAKAEARKDELLRLLKELVEQGKNNNASNRQATNSAAALATMEFGLDESA